MPMVSCLPVATSPRPTRATGRPGLLALLLVFLALTTAYATVVPTFEGPDSGAHLRFIAWLQEGRGRPALDAATAAESHEIVYQPPLYYGLAAALLAGIPVRPALALEVMSPHWPALSPRATVTPPEVPNAAAFPERLAAFVSLLGALLAIIATWGIGRNLVPQSPGFALAAAAVLGLNPQLLFSAATVTNDTWAAGTAALAVWLAARGVRRQAAPLAWLAVGAAVGLAMLAKYSGLVVIVPVGVLWLAYTRRQPGLRRGALAGAWLVAGTMVVAGPWYGENWLRWGAPIPSGQFQVILPHLFRTAPTSWQRALAELPWLQRSYWGVFGYGVAAPEPYPQLVDGLLLAAGLGLAVLAGRWAWSRRSGTRPSSRIREVAAAALVAGLWLLPTLAALLQFSRSIKFGLHGRLLFPAAGAVALLLVAGWTTLTPRRAWPWLHALVPLGFALLAIWQLVTLQQAYAIPPAMASPIVPSHSVNAHFEGGMVLRGVDLPDAQRVQAGSPYPVRLYLAADGVVDGFYRRVVALVTTDGRPIAQVDGVPADGHHPTRQWRPSEVFTETVRLDVPPLDRGQAVSLVVRFYDPETGTARALLDGSGQPAAEAATVRRLRLVGTAEDPGPCPPADVTDGASWPPKPYWENGLALVDGQVSAPAPTGPQMVRLTWTTAEPLSEDLTVFVQALDASGRLVAQSDRRPRDGRLPTDTWLPCEQVVDEHQLAIPSGDWDQIIVGWYRPDQSRLRLEGGVAGSADHFVLATANAVGP